MGAANTVINHPNEYRQIVNQHPLVFVLFVSKDCTACQGANKRFEDIASQYTGHVKSMILDKRETPQIKELGEIGTPTLVVYQNAEEVKRFMGIGAPEDQKDYLKGIFSHYVNDTPLPTLPFYF